jgi:hypothetical protein
MALGEAAGVAAAQVAASGKALRELDVAALQRQLLTQGAYLGGDTDTKPDTSPARAFLS